MIDFVIDFCYLSFRPAETTENLINCQPMENDQTIKPKKLQDIEVCKKADM